MIVDQTGNAIRYTHGKKSLPVHVDDRPLTAVSCSGPAACFAADDKGYLSRFNGKRWTAPVHVARTGLGELPVISCPYYRQCMAGFGGKVYHWNGVRWSSPHTLVGRRGDLTGISCPQRDFCLAVAVTGGDGTLAFRYNGHTWRSIHKAFRTNEVFAAVACSGPRFCVVAGDEGSAATFDGHAWTRVDLNGRGFSRSASCMTAKFCLVVTDYGFNWLWDGTRWRRGPHAGYDRTLDAVSCPAVDECSAIDQLGYLLHFDRQRWHVTGAVDPSTDQLEAMACASKAACFAADEDGNVARFDGTSWHAPRPVDPHADPGLERAPQLSCSGPALCLLVDWRGYTMRWNGSGWHPAGRSPFGDEGELSCAGSHWCMAIGAVDGHHGTYHFAYSVLRETAWTRPAIMHGLPGVGVGYFEFSCANPNFCMLIHEGHRYSVFHGAGWSHLRRVTSSDGHSYGSLGYVSCPTGSHCILTTYKPGATLRFDHGVWTRGAGSPGGTSVGHLVCTSAKWCVGQDYFDRIDYFDGSSWTVSSAALFPPPGHPQDSSWAVTALACSTDEFCVATDGTRAAHTV